MASDITYAPSIVRHLHPKQKHLKFKHVFYPFTFKICCNILKGFPNGDISDGANILKIEYDF